MKYKYITSIVTILIVLFVSAMSIITPDNKISELEGRELQKLPTAYNIYENNSLISNLKLVYHSLTGQLFKWWDSYFSDHIYNRDIIVGSFTELQKILDKKYINGVYLSDDGYILSKPNSSHIDKNSVKERTEFFNKTGEILKDKKIYLVHLPTKTMVYENKIPIEGYEDILNNYADYFLEGIDSENLEVIDVRDVINSKDDNLYYKTDHHWNMNGVYKGYKYIIDNLNDDFENIGNPNSKDIYDIEFYKEYFLGSDGRKVGQIVKEMDDIEVYKYNNIKEYDVFNEYGETSLYHTDKLSKTKLNSDYQVYLGGNNAELIIKNKDESKEVNIVMIGDSMDNPLIPLMAPHFSNIYSYDLRMYKDNIIDRINEINPDVVMFIGITYNFINNTTEFNWNI